ncbi:hypothetical protein ES703_64938 [subsurface metagenome]
MLLILEVLLGKRVCIGQTVDTGCKYGFGTKHIEHSASEKRGVGDGCGKHHKWIIVGGAVLSVPDVFVPV